MFQTETLPWPAGLDKAVSLVDSAHFGAVMRFLLRTTLLGIALLHTALSATGAPLAAEQIYQRLLPSTCTIFREDQGLGSGFVIDGAGHVATNYHVVDGTSLAFVKCGESIGLVNSIVRRNPEVDLVVLSTTLHPMPPAVRIATREPTVGATVFALGSPFGLEATISQGIVSASPREIDGQRLIQVTAPIGAGSSGGPLVNDEGEVFGIATGAIESGDNIAFAIPVSELTTLRQSQVPLGGIPTGEPPDSGAGGAAASAGGEATAGGAASAKSALTVRGIPLGSQVAVVLEEEAKRGSRIEDHLICQLTFDRVAYTDSSGRDCHPTFEVELLGETASVTYYCPKGLCSTATFSMSFGDVAGFDAPLPAQEKFVETVRAVLNEKYGAAVTRALETSDCAKTSFWQGKGAYSGSVSVWKTGASAEVVLAYSKDIITERAFEISCPIFRIDGDLIALAHSNFILKYSDRSMLATEAEQLEELKDDL